MHQAGRVDWDIAYIVVQNYPAMHEAAMLVPVDYTLWDEGPLEGTPQHARLKDAIVVFQTAGCWVTTSVRFPTAGRKNWIKKFAGARSLEACLARIRSRLRCWPPGVPTGISGPRQTRSLTAHSTSLTRSSLMLLSGGVQAVKRLNS